MGKKIIYLVVIVSIFISCKKTTCTMDNKKFFDTLFVESSHRVDTTLLRVEKSSENIWLNKVTYSSAHFQKHLLIGSSLTHNKYILVNNIKDKLDVEILGDKPSIKVYKLKSHNFIVSEDSLYNYGILTKIYCTFLINKDLSVIHKEKFELNSKDDGKSYDKRIEFHRTKDTLFIRYNYH